MKTEKEIKQSIKQSMATLKVEQKRLKKCSSINEIISQMAVIKKYEGHILTLNWVLKSSK